MATPIFSKITMTTRMGAEPCKRKRRRRVRRCPEGLPTAGDVHPIAPDPKAPAGPRGHYWGRRWCHALAKVGWGSPCELRTPCLPGRPPDLHPPHPSSETARGGPHVVHMGNLALINGQNCLLSRGGQGKEKVIIIWDLMVPWGWFGGGSKGPFPINAID